ncbi:MAG: ATP-binding protein [Acidobacteriota bacterium]|nr:ATP-binding protein [Acidobacteriota bacterium]
MPPAKTLREAYNAANPTEPLSPGDPRYVDCNDVRGNEDAVAHMFTTVTFSDTHTHQIFTGHRGCGKSTELLRLKDQLEREAFYVVYFAVDDYLDPNDLLYTDLLLSIARQVEESFRADEVDMSEALKGIETWFSEVVYQKSEWESVEQELKNEASIGIGLPGGVPLIARLLTKLTGQIKTGDAVKKEIRQRLDSQI